jgi:hypothetical protein
MEHDEEERAMEEIAGSAGSLQSSQNREPWPRYSRSNYQYKRKGLRPLLQRVYGTVDAGRCDNCDATAAKIRRQSFGANFILIDQE